MHMVFKLCGSLQLQCRHSSPLCRSARQLRLFGSQGTIIKDRDVVASSQPENSGPDDALLKDLMKNSRLTHLAHQIWPISVRKGDVVCDATCGNGYDSVYLAKLVGPDGHLVAIDIQKEAVRATQDNIEAQVPEHERPKVTYVVGSHENLIEHVGSNVAKLVCFNLGYLPGGDKSIVTQVDSTLAAIEASLEALVFGGIVSILCYIGHPGGMAEYEAVQEYVSQLSPKYWVSSEFTLLNSPTAPIMIMIWKRVQ
ncbi:hypothetical protein M9434_000449 [Picochlorum sp. BPE23]|nr:hypothetical protein M9434_000449 [Picochlorum sp. BPE23]